MIAALLRLAADLLDGGEALPDGVLEIPDEVLEKQRRVNGDLEIAYRVVPGRRTGLTWWLDESAEGEQ